MKVGGQFSTRLDAELAGISLDAAGVPSVIVGTGVELEGGPAGVQLLVPDEWFAAATSALEQPSRAGARRS